jgi:hypothetical protein
MNAKSQQSTTSSGSSTTNPWAPQAGYLTQAFSGADNALNKASGATIPTNFTAQYTPDQISAYQQMLTSGLGNKGLYTSSGDAGNTASGAAATGISNAVTGLAGFTPQGGTQANIDAANQYVAGQNIPAQVQADMQMANQEAKYVTNPGIDAAAAGSGNINSSRDAIQHGLVATNLAESANNDAAKLQANAYNTGLGLSEQNNEAANTNRIAALTGGLYGGAMGLNAGSGANSTAVGNMAGLYNIANAGVTGGYNANQAPLTNQLQQWQNQTNDPFAALQNFYNIVGANNWGNSTTGSSTQNQEWTPSTMSQIGGWTNFVGSLL